MEDQGFVHRAAMAVLAEYYKQQGRKPDIIALPALIKFAEWMVVQSQTEQEADG